MSKRFITVVLGLFIVIGAGFLFVLRWGSQLPLARYEGGPPPLPAPSPAPPSVNLSIIRGAKGDTFLIQWANLPCNATALDIFRSKIGKSSWLLWKVVKLSEGRCASGEARFSVSKADAANYEFYAQAVAGENNTTSTISTVLWTSSSTAPAVVTSTPPVPGGNPAPGGSPSNTSTATSSSSGTGTASTGTGTGSQTPSGTPYYNPQIQISGYGQGPPGSFWVQHVDRKIQLGWQNLPQGTTRLVVYRSASQDGPWSSVLAQENPGIGGPYSIQIVDDTLGQPYYYKMDAFAGSSLAATYGPVYLPPVGQ